MQSRVRISKSFSDDFIVQVGFIIMLEALSREVRSDGQNFYGLAKVSKSTGELKGTLHM